MPAATLTEPASVPKVQQVLHVRAKSILSCTFARSAASNRGVAPPPSFQSVTINSVTTLLHLNSHDGTIRSVGSIEWDTSPEEERGKKQPPAHKVTVGDHSGELRNVLKTGKGIGKDLKFRSDTRAIYLPNSDSPLHFQRVALPSGGFPYTVYTISDASLPPGPTPAHTCVGQLTIKHVSKKLQVPTTDRPSTVRLWALFISEEDRNRALEDRKRMVIRLELRTRDKALIDKIVFSSLLVVAGKHPSEADSQVEQGRPAVSEENEWDPPPALSNLATPSLTPTPSAEHLPTHNCPGYGDDGSQVQLLSPADNSSTRDDAVSDQSVPGPSVERSAVAV